MKRSRVARCATAALGLFLAGCGAEDSPIGIGQTGDPQSTPGEDTADAPVAAAGDAVERRVQPYPEGPYGVGIQSTVANFEFFGWQSPAADKFDATAGRTISFADFYDPDGDKGNEVLFVSAVATWCVACQQEYRELQDANIVKEFSDRGVVFFGALFENQDAQPPSFADLEAWVEAFEVDFPFATDPGLKLGIFFERQATPMNMIVDLRTMRVLHLQTGYSAEVFDQLDGFLKMRGR